MKRYAKAVQINKHHMKSKENQLWQASQASERPQNVSFLLAAAKCLKSFVKVAKLSKRHIKSKENQAWQVSQASESPQNVSFLLGTAKFMKKLR